MSASGGSLDKGNQRPHSILPPIRTTVGCPAPERSIDRNRTMNVFAYGSLILPEVWGAVTGERHRSEPGRLSGYIRRRVRGATYPGIVTDDRSGAGEWIDGAIYYDVGADALAALDEFESDFYVRVTLEAHDGRGEAVRCEAYLVPPENAHLLSDEVWDLDRFRSEHLTEFLGRNFA